jgi:glycosyltransferase involved in cell wall biosynthesis
MTGSRIRVLHVIASVSPVRGGPSSAAWSTVDALHASGVDVDLVTTDDDGPGRHLAVPLGVLQEQRGYRVAYFRRQLGPYTFSAPLLQWLRCNAHRYDVVHAHGLFTFAPVAAALCARARGVPYVLRPNGVLNQWGLTHRRPQLKRVSLQLVERRLLSSAAFVHFTSENELADARALDIPMCPLVMPLGVNAPGPASIAAQRDATAPRILFLARIVPIKNLDLLLQAFGRIADRFPTARVVVAGDGTRDDVEPLKRMAGELGIGERIDWLGFVQGEARESAFRTATLLTLPSTAENFGIAAVEALARGIPVVVSRGVGVAERILEARAGLVCEPAVDDIADCLARLLADPGLQREMGQAARRLYTQEYTPQATGRKLREAYESILAQRRIAGTRTA